MEQYLKVLIQSMNAKEECLNKLLEKTEAQTGILKEESMDWDSFDRLIDEKAELIEELDRLDDGFQKVFDRIRDELDGRRAEFKEEIGTLQRQIRKVTEQSTSLMAAEQRNKDLVTSRAGKTRQQIREGRANARAVTTYYNNMNQINTVDPQLMDKKK
ncbi:MAG: flagellar protein FlgN [Lachnospiraceae bacterium]|nr:flagellar protein FlgN [Lachnospiraceae bacterium]